MASPAKLLLVDDIPENIKVLAEHLSDGYDVAFALSGPEALDRIARIPPDLILLDAMMPEMDGYAVCAALKREPNTREIPIIFVTAKNDAESESRALAAGAVDFIHKPVNRDVVRARVRMHLDLRAQKRQLEALNAELERRVEERTLALRDSMILAQAAQRSRNLFLANVNHELRTPMNAIMGLSVLLARQVADPKLRERADKIGVAGRQLLRIVDDIIDIADIQAGKVAINATDFGLSALLDAAVEAWRGPAEAKGLELAREIDPALPLFLRGDSKRLGQMLDNLLSNAVKFSGQGRIVPRARLSEARENRLWVRFEVEDQGIGVEPERRQAIFEVFDQADNSKTRRYQGAGIGLAICKQLAGLMGGSIGMDSAPGHGSTFWILVPLEPGAAPTAPEPKREVHGQDRDRVDQVLSGLISLLSGGGELQAFVAWTEARDLLETALGERLASLGEAMENLDFPTALELLRAVHPHQSEQRKR